MYIFLLPLLHVVGTLHFMHYKEVKFKVRMGIQQTEGLRTELPPSRGEDFHMGYYKAMYVYDVVFKKYMKKFDFCSTNYL